VLSVAAGAPKGSVESNPVGWMAGASREASELTLALGEAALHGEDENCQLFGNPDPPRNGRGSF
jgi:hypothetical protein